MTEPARSDAPIVWMSFDLVGDSFDPDVVTQRLGIRPTSQHRAGDSIRAGLGRRQHDRWRVTVGPREVDDVGGMVDELLASLESARPKLRGVCQAFGLGPTILCAVEPKSSRVPDVTFSAKAIQWAAEIGCAISVDLMLWREESGGQ